MTDKIKGRSKTVTIDGQTYPRLSLSEVRDKLRFLAQAYQMPELHHLAIHLERAPVSRRQAPGQPVNEAEIDPMERRLVLLCQKNNPTWPATDIAAHTKIKLKVVEICLEKQLRLS